MLGFINVYINIWNLFTIFLYLFIINVHVRSGSFRNYWSLGLYFKFSIPFFCIQFVYTFLHVHRHDLLILWTALHMILTSKVVLRIYCCANLPWEHTWQHIRHMRSCIQNELTWDFVFLIFSPKIIIFSYIFRSKSLRIWEEKWHGCMFNRICTFYKGNKKNLWSEGI